MGNRGRWFFWITCALLTSACVWASDRAVLIADATSQAVQNARADSENLSRMTDFRMLRSFERSGRLVAVPSSTSDYYVNAIPAAYRYCRPWTKLFLMRISQQFQEQFGDRLRVTSLVRTAGRQRALERTNGNAAEASGPERSSHLTGATIDISKRFMSPAEQQWMRDTLYSLREAGYVYAIEEFWQPTFHVMVYRSYSGYAHRLTHRHQVHETKVRENDRDQASDVAAEDTMR